jgi:hypothetical protein
VKLEVSIRLGADLENALALYLARRSKVEVETFQLTRETLQRREESAKRLEDSLTGIALGSATVKGGHA